ncbi:hypothetical protein [Xanthomonas campestris]|uniref:hypothetical protein n=1 Tax=Xanthomonas campestris TaxID=339 RepID=UPI00094B4FE3|nr:hypothetical protein [Xanthomonas campestris]MEA0761504.1 hypothetical protein [Xanthomonas campestris pv. campestris]MEB1223698.1 hypothetical protein [Xanthomonas campestris pv. campestris]MEB1245184.1 hypothetical protein [Xanthomonas campestris pv. campestris]MEB1252790.1 hypothetical protein [Xanthomonas campestris pv. campestris]MEB1261446.1 hypothetical protein [Xanthomonas campestris pv. campestris]
MNEPTHYHQKIQRATERLAQLQARELLARQRQAARAKQAAKQEEARRRQRVAELVFVARADSLDDEELVGALQRHLEAREGSSQREASSAPRFDDEQHPI